MASHRRYVTQSEAVALCGVDYSTIKRHRERGRFPGTRRRDDVNRTYEIPVDDLVSAGLWRPAEGVEEADVAAVIGRARTEHRVEELRIELERARAQNGALASVGPGRTTGTPSRSPVGEATTFGRRPHDADREDHP